MLIAFCFTALVVHSTLSKAAVPDFEQPKVQCPDDILINSKASSEIVSWKVKATDNSGLPPTISCSPKNGSSMKVPSRVVVGCEAKDAAGNYARCFFSIDVKDVAPPKITCPADFEIISDKPQVRVNYERLNIPIDNDGLPPVVSCTRQSGVMTHNPGLYTITCTVRDQSMNRASCSFKVNIKSPECKKYPPPKDGTLACNDLSSSNKACTVSCNTKYDFIHRPGNLYICSYGNWVNGDGILYGRIPWPDCSVKSNTNKRMMDSLFYYKGNAKDPAVIQQIQNNYISILKNTRYAPPFLCSGNSNCKASNVKVTAG